MAGEEKGKSEAGRRNSENLTERDKSWIMGASLRSGFFNLFKLWANDEDLWQTLVGDIGEKPEEERGIRRANLKTPNLRLC